MSRCVSSNLGSLSRCVYLFHWRVVNDDYVSRSQSASSLLPARRKVTILMRKTKFRPLRNPRHRQRRMLRRFLVSWVSLPQPLRMWRAWYAVRFLFYMYDTDPCLLVSFCPHRCNILGYNGFDYVTLYDCWLFPLRNFTLADVLQYKYLFPQQQMPQLSIICCHLPFYSVCSQDQGCGRCRATKRAAATTGPASD